MAEDSAPDALHAPVAVVVALFSLYTILSVVGLVLIKKYLSAATSDASAGDLTAASVWWSALGAASYIASFLIWLALLTQAPLSVAYPVAVGATMCLTLVASLWVFHERPTAAQLVGTVMVFGGIGFIASGLRR